MEDICDVIIIGAGMSGLAAAKQLAESGYQNIKILEARNRTGGRIHTIRFGLKDSDQNGQLAEMGANWIHGTENNSIYDIANSLNLLKPLITHSEFDGIYISESGQHTDKNLVAAVIKQLKKNVQEMTDLEETDETFYRSSFDYLEECMLDQLYLFKDSQREAMNVFHCLIDICKEDCGDDLQLLSMQECGFEDDFVNENFLLPNGFQSLLKIFETYSEGKTEFETRVELIDWTERASGNGKYVLVTCNKNGIQATYKAKHVLSTLPLGILKASHTTLFKPNLPDRKVAAIQNLGFGRVNKILLYYENPFWKPGIASYKLVWEHDRPPSFSVKPWAKCLISFKEMKYNPNMLVGWVTGQAAADLEDIPLSEISEVCTTVLRHFLQDKTIPLPDNIVTSRWCSDPYCKGAYSYVRKGQDIDDMNKLGEPVNDKSGIPTILFAGEATDMSSYGSVHGALDSGVREASRLLKHWKTVESLINT